MQPAAPSDLPSWITPELWSKTRHGLKMFLDGKQDTRHNPTIDQQRFHSLQQSLQQHPEHEQQELVNQQLRRLQHHILQHLQHQQDEDQHQHFSNHSAPSLAPPYPSINAPQHPSEHSSGPLPRSHSASNIPLRPKPGASSPPLRQAFSSPPKPSSRSSSPSSSDSGDIADLLRSVNTNKPPTTNVASQHASTPRRRPSFAECFGGGGQAIRATPSSSAVPSKEVASTINFDITPSTPAPALDPKTPGRKGMMEKILGSAQQSQQSCGEAGPSDPGTLINAPQVSPKNSVSPRRLTDITVPPPSSPPVPSYTNQPWPISSSPPTPLQAPCGSPAKSSRNLQRRETFDGLLPPAHTSPRVTPKLPRSASFTASNTISQQQSQPKRSSREACKRDTSTATPTTAQSEYSKPNCSYAGLIGQAILAHPKKRISLADIYSWIMSTYAYYRLDESGGWQNSIRHNLSLNECFVKTDRRSDDDPGKGGLWMIKPGTEACFKDGGFKKSAINLAQSSGSSGSGSSECSQKSSKRKRSNDGKPHEPSESISFPSPPADVLVAPTAHNTQQQAQAQEPTDSRVTQNSQLINTKAPVAKKMKIEESRTIYSPGSFSSASRIQTPETPSVRSADSIVASNEKAPATPVFAATASVPRKKTPSAYLFEEHSNPREVMPPTLTSPLLSPSWNRDRAKKIFGSSSQPRSANAGGNASTSSGIQWPVSSPPSTVLDRMKSDPGADDDLPTSTPRPRFHPKQLNPFSPFSPGVVYSSSNARVIPGISFGETASPTASYSVTQSPLSSLRATSEAIQEHDLPKMDGDIVKVNTTGNKESSKNNAGLAEPSCPMTPALEEPAIPKTPQPNEKKLDKENIEDGDKLTVKKPAAASSATASPLATPKRKPSKKEPHSPNSGAVLQTPSRQKIYFFGTPGANPSPRPLIFDSYDLDPASPSVTSPTRGLEGKKRKVSSLRERENDDDNLEISPGKKFNMMVENGIDMTPLSNLPLSDLVTADQVS